jgi:uncharacterized protein
MFSLQKLLGKEDKFFTLLEKSAEQARYSVQALVKLSNTPNQTSLSYEFIEARRKDKEITAELREAIYTTFVTALEREDIEALANALYRIPKTVEKIAERIMLAPQHVRGVDLSKQITLLAQAAEQVLALVKSLRKGAVLDDVKTLNDRLQFVEGEADKAIIDSYRELFNGNYEPVKVIFLKDLYELIEKVIDRCRDAGNVISHIVLKNS